MPHHDEVKDDEEWVLDHIVHHRTVKKVRSGPTDDDDSTGGMEYQCKWRGYDEPTWEPRPTLENDYVRELVSYENAVAAKRVSANRPPPKSNNSGKKPTRGEVTVGDVCPPPGLDKDHPHGDPQCISDLCGFDVTTDAQQPEELCPDNVIDYAAQVYGCGVCATDEQIATFMKLHNELQASHRPVILYHGNVLRHLPDLCKNGLVVPKTEKDVGYTRNGMGIFATFNLLDCAEFCQSQSQCMRVLCCVALTSTSDRSMVVKPKSHVLFKRADLILPVWALDIAVECYKGHGRMLEQRVHTYTTLGTPYPAAAKHRVVKQQ